MALQDHITSMQQGRHHPCNGSHTAGEAQAVLCFPAALKTHASAGSALFVPSRRAAMHIQHEGSGTSLLCLPCQHFVTLLVLMRPLLAHVNLPG